MLPQRLSNPNRSELPQYTKRSSLIIVTLIMVSLILAVALTGLADKIKVLRHVPQLQLQLQPRLQLLHDQDPPRR